MVQVLISKQKTHVVDMCISSAFTSQARSYLYAKYEAAYTLLKKRTF